MALPSTVSLVTATDAGPSATVAFLAAWRPHVDELIVAIDERADPRTPAACAALADRVEVVPAAPNRERYLPWLYAQASCDWLLRMDAHELPTDALLTALPELIASREHTHYWLPSLSLATPSTYIAAEPWVSEMHPRLARSIGGLQRASGREFQEVEFLGAYRFTDAPYLQVPGAFEILTRHPTLATAELAAADAARVAAYIDAAAETPRSAPTEAERATPTVPLAQIENHLHEIPTPARHASRTRLVHPIEPLTCGETRLVLVDVENVGDGVWPPSSDGWPQVRVGHRWYRSDGSLLEVAETRGYFTERVTPGARTRVHVPVVGPAEPGVHEVRIDVLEELAGWFEQPATQIVMVNSAPPVVQRKPPADDRPRREIFADDLRALHDALASTPFATRYWVWGGMLLGWAREGALLESDLYDVDFCFLAGDPAFPAAVEALFAAGFAPHKRYRENGGRTTEWVFERNGAKFEFFAVVDEGDELSYYSYNYGPPPCQVLYRFAAQPREDFEFLDRRWSKHRDHDLELTTLYGDWRTPDPDWWYMRSGGAVAREPWYRTDSAWDGTLDHGTTTACTP